LVISTWSTAPVELLDGRCAGIPPLFSSTLTRAGKAACRQEHDNDIESTWRRS